MLPIFNLIRDLESITRWSHAHCLKPESVLEHTGFVVLFSLLLSNKYDTNIEHALIKAAVHDLEETEIGDIPTPTKYANSGITEMINAIEYESAEKIIPDVFDEKIFNFWVSSKDLSTKAGQIVYIADLAAVVYKIWHETSLGNKTFEKFIPGIEDRLGEASKKVDTEFVGVINSLFNVLRKL